VLLDKLIQQAGGQHGIANTVRSNEQDLHFHATFAPIFR
jgi:hypothetical protein